MDSVAMSASSSSSKILSKLSAPEPSEGVRGACRRNSSLQVMPSLLPEDLLVLEDLPMPSAAGA